MKLKQAMVASAASLLPLSLMAAVPMNHAPTTAFRHYQPEIKQGVAQWKPKIKLKKLGKRLNINGFLSAGISYQNMQDGRYGIPNFGTVTSDARFAPNTLAGLQFSANITKQLSAVVQFVASGSNRNGNEAYQLRAQWAFVRYNLSSNFQFRAGRFRMPTFLYSDTAEVGYSYPWVWLPNEVYRIIPFQNFNAASVSIKQPLGNSGWSVGLQPFFGANQSKYDIYHGSLTGAVLPTGASPINGNNRVTVKFDEDNIAGGVVTLSNPDVTLRADYIHANITGSIDSYTANMNEYMWAFTRNGELQVTPKGASAYFYSFAGRVNSHHVLAIAEYARRRAFKGVASLEGYYGTLGYRYGKWLPNFTYAHLGTTNLGDLNNPYQSPLVESRQDQQSYTAGLDYYVNSNLVLKAAVYQITPLNGSSGLFDYMPTKKHVYMYTLGLSAIF